MSKKPQSTPFNRAFYPEVFSLEREFIENVPDVVYHYTNISSFVDILTTGKLRASRAEYLNDATEFRYGQRIVIEQIEILEKEAKYWRLLSMLKDELGVESASPFIVCFCGSGDLLSQWRGYSQHGYGISVGFNSEALRKIEKVDVNNVVYDKQRQTSFVSRYLKHLADTCLAVGPALGSPETHPFIVGLAGSLEIHCALLKDPAFAEENEVRLLIPDFDIDSTDDIKFRIRNNLIVPYIELDLDSIRTNLIAEIIVGPGPDREARKSSIEHFLGLVDIQVPVRFSSCQFR